HHQPRASIVVQGFGAVDLGEWALTPRSPAVHLPGAVMRHEASLREEEIILKLCVVVWKTQLVAWHLDGCGEGGRAGVTSQSVGRAGDQQADDGRAGVG